ncbi:DUF3313 domain-containing protein [Rhodopseudomonas palustris]|uniref:DUF3313 domain-containing protein n=1 Tax=Rhodopseudomonas palustris (strain BisB18) TaxID=316056 RepID=Q212W3_RHOPB
MRSAAELDFSSIYKTFRFRRLWRAEQRGMLSDAMTALMLVTTLRVTPLASGCLTGALMQLLFAVAPTRSLSRTAAGWRELVRGQPSPSLLTMLAAMTLSGCATAPLVQGTGLSSYDGLQQSDGKITKSRLHVKKEQVAAAKTINIAPTLFPPNAAPTLSSEQRALVANAVNRALCISLSDRFEVIAAGRPADLTVRAAVTHATETDEAAAGVSVAASIGTKFVDMGSVPIPIPRVPIGLGELSIEAEAVDRGGRQQAAIVWARGATAFFSSPRVSKAGDAYELAGSFGEDFATLLNKGESPFGGVGFSVPSWQKISSNVGLAPKYAACESYGRSPGVAGLVGGKLGFPPEWTDDGANSAATR